jgi:hypothetical protein
MNRFKRSSALIKAFGLSALLTLALLAACSDSGPAEEAGERIDDAVEEAGERIEETTRKVEDAIDPPGPAEKAGREIDDAIERARGD